MSVEIKSLLENTDKSKLINYLIRLADRDESIKSELLMEFGEPDEELEMELIMESINRAIREGSNRGYIDYRGCNHVCAVFDECTSRGEICYDAGGIDIALDIYAYVLRRAAGISSRADSSSGALTDSINRCIADIAKLCAEVQDENKYCNYLIKLASKKVFLEFDDIAVALFEIASHMVNVKSAVKLRNAFAKLIDQTRYGIEYLKDRQTEIEYNIIEKLEGKQAAISFAYKNIDIDNLRKTVVSYAMEMKDYYEAERLCVEASEKYHNNHILVKTWLVQLFELYSITGETDKLEAAAKALIYDGKTSYYYKLKEEYIRLGIWEQKYPVILGELKEKLMRHLYAEILKSEHEWVLLFELLKQDNSLIEQCAEVLAPYYPKEIFRMYSEMILHRATDVNDRRGYRWICGSIEKLSKLGGTAEATNVINSLREKYPRRAALIDELGKTEAKIIRDKSIINEEVLV